MARSFALPLALVALVACAPLLVASTCVGGTDTSWACSACSTVFFTSDLIGKCKTCVDNAGAGAWACVNDCPRAPVTNTVDGRGSCLTCVGAAKTNAWACSSCNTVTDPGMLKACYDCAGNSALQQFGWYCQRMIQTQGCYGTAAAFNSAGSGCLGCMAAAGTNNVDACLQCAVPGASDGDKQTCMNCVVARKDGGGSAYSCPSVCGTGLNAAKCRACILYNGPKYVDACVSCTGEAAATNTKAYNECAWCARAGKPASACIGKVAEVPWGFVKDIDLKTPNQEEVAPCGQAVLHWGSGTHNVVEVQSEGTGQCAAGVEGVAAPSSGGITSDLYTVTSAAPRYFICSVGNHCGATGSDRNMRMKITNTGVCPTP